MKGKAILSAVPGFFFGMIGFFVLLFLNMDGAGLLAVLAGLLFAAPVIAMPWCYRHEEVQAIQKRWHKRTRK